MCVLVHLCAPLSPGPRIAYQSACIKNGAHTPISCSCLMPPDPVLRLFLYVAWRGLESERATWALCATSGSDSRPLGKGLRTHHGRCCCRTPMLMASISLPSGECSPPTLLCASTSDPQPASVRTWPCLCEAQHLVIHRLWW